MWDTYNRYIAVLLWGGAVGVPVLLLLLALSCAGVRCPASVEWRGWAEEATNAD